MADLKHDWQQVCLPNGLRLITVARPGTRTVAVRAYVRAGSRYDQAYAGETGISGPRLGLSHMTEHLLFQGTQHHSQRQLFARVERLGGALEAGTTKEYAAYSAVTTRQGLDTAVEILASVLAAPALREDAFWREKLVILEEVRRASDQQSALFDLFAGSLWQAHPLRNPIHGTLEALQRLQHADVVVFYQQRYVAGNMLLVVCGDIDHERTQCLVAERFAALPPGPEQPPDPVHEPPLDSPRAAHLDKDLHQAHLLLGVPTAGLANPDRSALKVIERVLGMGASARLYQRLREEARLVYSVNTVSAHYEDAGYLAVHAACDPGNLGRVREAILAEWKALRQQGVTSDELAAAKGNYAGTLARRFETNLTVAGIFGIEALLHHVETFEHAVSRVGAVDRDEVVRVARRYLDLDCYVSVSLGRSA